MGNPITKYPNEDSITEDLEDDRTTEDPEVDPEFAI